MLKSKAGLGVIAALVVLGVGGYFAWQKFGSGYVEETKLDPVYPLCLKVENTQPKRCGLLDKNDQWILQPVYNYISVGSKNRWVRVEDRSKKTGLYSIEKGWVVQPSFKYLNTPTEGIFSALSIGKKTYQYYDTSGKQISPHAYVGVRSFVNGYAVVQAETKRPSHFIIDRKTRKTHDTPFYYIGPVSKKGLAPAQKVKGGLYGVIDTKGRWTLQPTFKYLYSAEVEKDSGLIPAVHKNGRHGYVDKDFNWKIKPQFQYTSPFRHGLGLVRLKQDLYGLLRKDGSWAIPAKYKNLYTADRQTMIAQTMSGKNGVLGRDGKWRIKPIYKNITMLGPNLYAANKDYGVGYKLIDRAGAQLSPATFTYAYRQNGRAAVEYGRIYKGKGIRGRAFLTPTGKLQPESANKEFQEFLKICKRNIKARWDLSIRLSIKNTYACLPMLDGLAHDGDKDAMAAMYIDLKKSKPRLAEKWMRRAAKAGHVKTMTDLGLAYYQGNYRMGIRKDRYLGIRWFKKAAKGGSRSAQSNLGVHYNSVRNYTEARYWYEQAAKQGHADAQYNLGLYYYYGTGVTKNLRTAEYWMAKAARQGGRDAKRNLRIIRSQLAGGGTGGSGNRRPNSLLDVFNTFNKVSNQGNRRYQCNIPCQQGKLLTVPINSHSLKGAKSIASSSAGRICEKAGYTNRNWTQQALFGIKCYPVR